MSKEEYEFDCAFVKYISGKKIETYMNQSEAEVKQLFMALDDSIRKLHIIKRDFAGIIEEPQKEEFKCENYILSNMENDMNYSIKNCSEVANKENKLRQAYIRLYKNIKPRKEYVLIYGELGSNHVLVDENKDICLIDIECVKYFDKEYENSFLEFRFGDYYKYLKEENLDLDRMKIYKLSYHIGCLSGAVKLTKEDFNGMIRYNLEQVLNSSR
ncbi:hypothetical protein CLPUN_26600 [Clostridium puniceum]|uniref:Phosphotransferase enzyme family protein n=1 Tax=Clostridium puniceum TaxID=29367 RepID=A0A1S8TFB4_9CLOT|nr:hypothetical protein [Clostridium puniceum]OOM76428.1 hypothetical protein CLPUN_26600 [Clostridium puniceum]